MASLPFLLTVKWPGIFLQILFSLFNILYSMVLLFVVYTHAYFLCFLSHATLYLHERYAYYPNILKDV